MDLITPLLHELKIVAELLNFSSLTAHSFCKMCFDQGGHFPKVRFQITFHIMLRICAYVRKWATLDEEKSKENHPRLRFIPCIEKKTDEQEDGSIGRLFHLASQQSRSATSIDEILKHYNKQKLPTTDPQPTLPTTSSPIKILPSPIVTDIGKKNNCGDQLINPIH